MKIFHFSAFSLVFARINDRAGYFPEEYDDQDEETRDEGFEVENIEVSKSSERKTKPTWRPVTNSKCLGEETPVQNVVFWRCSVLELAKRTKKRCRGQFC